VGQKFRDQYQRKNFNPAEKKVIPRVNNMREEKNTSEKPNPSIKIPLILSVSRVSGNFLMKMTAQSGKL
jgi:hypothetical protein